MDQISKQKFDEKLSPIEAESPKELLRVRCPECLKLYAIRTDEITESRPRFQCVGCEKQFWVSYPEVLSMGEEVLGYPLEWIEGGELGAVETAVPGATAERSDFRREARDVKSNYTNANPKVFACPKCGEGYAAGDSECVKCGVVFLKIKESSRPVASDIAASVEVREFWDAVLNDYENFERHQAFINAAFADRSLTYAAQHYSRILEVCPQDDIAQRAQKEVSALAFARFESQIVKNGPTKKSFFSDLDISFRQFRFTTLLLVMCAIVITMGFILPHQRNLVGVGTAVMFFILALRFYFRVI